MRPKLNESGTSVLEFIYQIRQAQKKSPEKSIEEIAETLFGPNVIGNIEDETTP